MDMVAVVVDKLLKDFVNKLRREKLGFPYL